MNVLIHICSYCPEGSVASVDCPAGHYCPDPTLKKACLVNDDCHETKLQAASEIYILYVCTSFQYCYL